MPNIEAATLEKLRAAKHVTIFRIQSPFTRDYDVARRTKTLVAGYPLLAQAPLSPERIDPLRSLILSKSTYGPEWTCLFDPGYVARFAGSAGSVDVVICFKCSDLFVKTGSEIGVGGNFMPAAKRLREIVTSPWAGT